MPTMLNILKAKTELHDTNYFIGIGEIQMYNYNLHFVGQDLTIL